MPISDRRTQIQDGHHRFAEKWCPDIFKCNFFPINFKFSIPLYGRKTQLKFEFEPISAKFKMAASPISLVFHTFQWKTWFLHIHNKSSLHINTICCTPPYGCKILPQFDLRLISEKSKMAATPLFLCSCPMITTKLFDVSLPNCPTSLLECVACSHAYFHLTH